MPSLRTICLVMLLAAPLLAGGPARDPWEFRYTANIPLGLDACRVGKEVVALLVSTEDPRLEGWRRLGQWPSTRLLDTAGNTPQFYPESLQFRITATTRERVQDTPFDVAVPPRSINELLKDLRFRLKVFRGLDVRRLEPESVTIIGVPLDIDYPERVYRATFALGRVSIEDRIVLEVLAPDGARLGRFHLDLK